VAAIRWRRPRPLGRPNYGRLLGAVELPAAGTLFVTVGPRTSLRGPPKVVMTLTNHDDHLHVRIRPGARARR